MLQREGFVVADMSASASTPSLLERSSWKAEAIRKGNLKISGPIPITEDMPLNDEEEKQYAEQNAQQNALDQTPQPQDAPTREEPQQPQQPQQETPISPRTVHSPPPAVSEHPSALRANPVVEQPEQEVEAREQRPSRSPPQNMRLVSASQRQSLAPQSALASPTPFRSTPESTAKANQKKRKSGLRNVFRKMFGKKPAETAQPQEDDSSRRGHSYHHSDPGLLRSTPPPERRESRPPPKAPTPVGPRISDLPVKELEPLHPLGQHLPYPMNVNAPPVSPPNEYLTFDLARTDLGRRRATLPTLPSAAVVRHSLDESRPKLPAWDERVEEGDVSPTGIGIAVSSPGQATSRHNKRRSRSADALHSLAKELASNERRRSDEIKYWRESYMSGSVYSRPETAKTVETFRSVHTQEPTIREPEGRDAFNEMSATLVQADDPQSPTSVAGRQREEEEEEEDPDGHASSVSDFNFGDLKNTVFGPSEAPAPEPEAEREPIAQPQQIPAAAPPLPPQSEKRLSLEDRVSNLESRYSVLETLTRRISANNNRQTIILENPPRNLRSRDRSTSVSASRSHSRSAPSIHQELRRPSTSEAVESGPAPGPATTTSPAHTASSNDEHANALQDMYAALQVERTARIALEQKVQTLQYDISNLHALVNKLIASGSAASPSYPTPSPDMLIMSSEGSDQRMNCSTPRASSQDQSSSFYSQTAQGDRHDWRNDSESIYSDDVPQDDVTSPDEWATPKEEGFAGSGFFHSEGKVRSH